MTWIPLSLVLPLLSHYQMTYHWAGLQSAIVLLLPAAIILSPAKFLDCLLHVALTQELEISKEGSKSSSSLEKCVKLVHILRLVNNYLKVFQRRLCYNFLNLGTDLIIYI